MGTIEKEIKNTKEYNLLSLLNANTNPHQAGFEYIRLDHNLRRAFVCDRYKLLVVTLEPEPWNEIFGSLPELLTITKLRKDSVAYVTGDEFFRPEYASIFSAVGQEPNYTPVAVFDLELLNCLTSKFDYVYFVKQAGSVLFMRLIGDKYPPGEYLAGIMPLKCDDDKINETLELLKELGNENEH